MADLTGPQLIALASEINTDPKTIGYAGKNNIQVAALLNTPGIGTTPGKVNNGVMPVQKLLNAIDGVELDALTTGKKMTLQIYFSSGSIDTGNQNVRDGLAAVFAPGTASRTNLQAIVDRSATRAEVLFGQGFVIDQRDVSAALGRSV